MNAVAYGTVESSMAVVSANGPELRGIAKAIGALYLVLASVAMFSAMVVEVMAVPGNPTATAENILGSIRVFELSIVGWVTIIALDAVIAVMLYLLLEPANRALALISATLRLLYTAILGSYVINLHTAHSLLTGATTPDAQIQAASAIETFSAGFLLALVFFGLHLIGLGIAFMRSRYVPQVLSVLLVAAGIGYVIETFASFFVTGYGGAIPIILAIPAILAEFGLPVWLLAKGVNTRAIDAEMPTNGNVE